MDTIAGELHLDLAEVRRRKLPCDFSRPTPAGLLYDSGNYQAALDKALAMVGEALRAEQQRLRAQGRYLGIGLASYIEISGIGPSFLLPPGMEGGRAAPFVSSPRAW